MTESPIQRPERLDPSYWRSGPDLPVRLQSPAGPEVVLAPRRPARPVAAEVAVAAGVSAAVAAAMGWKVLAHLGHAVPGGRSTGGAPFTGLWALAWSGHALRPGSGIGLQQLFDGNAFYPAQYSLAFGDSLLGLGPLTWLPSGGGGLVTIYGLLWVFAPALTAFGGYALGRQLGAHPLGAAVLGAAVAWTPWRETQLGSLSVLWLGSLTVALALLARGHGFTMSGRRPGGRPLWALLGWVAAAFQLAVGFTVGLPFAYLLAVVAVLVLLSGPVRALARRRRLARAAPVGWDATAAAELARRDADVHARNGFWNQPGDGYDDSGAYDDPAATQPLPVDEVSPGSPPVRVADRPRRLGWLAVVDLAGGAAFAGFGLLMAYPYFRVRAIDPVGVRSSRQGADLASGSVRLVDLLTPPSAVRNTYTWLPLDSLREHLGHRADAAVLPGAVLIVLAALGLALSSWRWWWRLLLVVAAGVVVALSLGTHFPAWFAVHGPGHASPFGLLARHVPGWAAVRAPARLVIFGVLALAVLAAGAVSRLAGTGPSRFRPLRLALVAVLPVLVVLEGWTWVPLTPAPAVPRAVSAAAGPLVVLPSRAGDDAAVMFWSAERGFPLLANGSNGITSTTLTYARTQLAGFPDSRSVAYLRANGFRSVAVLRPAAGRTGRPAADRIPSPSLHLTRVDLGDSVLYTLDPID